MRYYIILVILVAILSTALFPRTVEEQPSPSQVIDPPTYELAPPKERR